MGVVSFLTAVIGGYVTFFPPAAEASKKKLLLAFVFLGLMTVVITCVQAYRSDKEQEKQENAQQDLNRQNQQLQKGLELLDFKSKDVLVEFTIEVPLDHPKLAKYRSRLEKCVEQMEKEQRLACGAHHRVLSAYPAKIKQIWIGADSELFPRMSSELVAYSTFSQLSLRFQFFKRKLSQGTLVHQQTVLSPALHRVKPILTFTLHQRLDSPENLKEKTTVLGYDFETRRVFISGSQVLVKHSEWNVSENLTSVAELLNDTMVVINASTFSGILKLDQTGSGVRLIEESQVAMEISETATLTDVTLTFSDGKRLKMQSDKLERVTDQSGQNNFVYVP